MPALIFEWAGYILNSIVEIVLDSPAVYRFDHFVPGYASAKRSVATVLGDPYRFGFLQKPKRSGLIPDLGNVALQNFYLMFHGAPEVVPYAIDLQEDVIEVPNNGDLDDVA